MQTFITSYRQIDVFSKQGAVQAVLDVLAIQSVLQSYLQYMPEVRGLIRLITDVVGLGKVESMVGKVEDAVMEREVFDVVMTKIRQWRKGCEMEFLCLVE
jgi:hypothetical protein